MSGRRTGGCGAISLGVVVLTLGGFAALLGYLRVSGTESGHQTLVAATDGREDAQLSILATASWQQPPAGGRVNIEAVVINRGELAVDDLRVLTRLVTDAAGGEGEMLSDCADGGAASTLAAGASRVLCGSLRFGKDPGERTVLLVASWSRGGRRAAVGLPLGPVPVTPFLVRWIEEATDILEALAWPLAVAIVGWILQLLLSDRQRTQQTWNLILPRCQESAERYYMPMWTVITGLLRESEKEPGDRDVKQIFWSFVLLLCHTGQLLRERGLFLLKDRRGEELIEAFAGAYLAFARRLGVREYWLLIETIDRFTILPKFEHQLNSQKANAVALQRYYRAFNDALDGPDFESLLIVLDVFRRVLVYETNVVYHQWYQRTERFPLHQLMKLLVGLDAASGMRDRMDGLRRSLRTYIREHRPVGYFALRLQHRSGN